MAYENPVKTYKLFWNWILCSCSQM